MHLMKMVGDMVCIIYTNLCKVLNNVLKGVCAMPVLAIVEYTFYKINSYFVHRWKKQETT
jgi:hypothetical protein